MKTCLIGENIGYTLSKEIHSLLGDNSYVIKDIKKDEISSILMDKYDGINVTNPYKEEVLKYVSKFDKSVQEIGAANTLVYDGKEYAAYNTDAYGFEMLLKDNKIDLHNKKVMILGSGGASKAIQYVANNHGAKKIYVVSRNGDINYDNMYNHSTDVLINATPIGKISNLNSLVDLDRLFVSYAVIDINYDPLNSFLLQEAKIRNLKTANGLSMLVNQAIKANALFFKKNELVPSNDILKAMEKEKENIVLIGMSGVGKSKIGEALAKKIGYDFVDIDTEIKKEYGDLVTIFKEKGEKEFRKYENKLIKKFSVLHRTVISTGGGSLLSSENVKYLKLNGKMILILRDLDNLDIEGRPLVKTHEEAKVLYEQRKGTYLINADIIVENNMDIDFAVNRIIDRI